LGDLEVLEMGPSTVSVDFVLLLFQTKKNFIYMFVILFLMLFLNDRPLDQLRGYFGEEL